MSLHPDDTCTACGGEANPRCYPFCEPGFPMGPVTCEGCSERQLRGYVHRETLVDALQTRSGEWEALRDTEEHEGTKWTAGIKKMCNHARAMESLKLSHGILRGTFPPKTERRPEVILTTSRKSSPLGNDE